MSDTPRTDAVAHEIKDTHLGSWDEIVPSGHARTLERELDTEVRRAEARLEEIERLNDKVIEVERQRAQAREERSVATEYAVQLKAERDMIDAHRNRLSDILTRIFACVGGPDEFIASDGKTYRFVPPDNPMYRNIYKLLCDRIRAIPDELSAALVAAQELERIPQVTLIQGGWHQVRVPKEPK